MAGNILRIGCCAFAATLLVAVATQPTSAAHRHSHHTKGASHSAGQNGARPASVDEQGGKPQDKSGLAESASGVKRESIKGSPPPEGQTTNDFKSNHIGAPDVNPVDSHITPPSHQANHKLDKLRRPNTRSAAAPRTVRAHHVVAARAANHDLRNAIGMRVTPAKGGSGWPSGSVPRVPEADRTALGVGRNGPGGIAKPDDNSARSNVGRFKPIRPNANPGVVPIALNRGMLGGAQFVRPGFAPSRLGGPANALIGIAGTTVQPKH